MGSKPHDFLRRLRLPRMILGSSGILYAVRDLFTTALAAGAVNGTASEPGPGTRVVTDTNSKLSIASGALDFATGGAGAGDPGLWYAAITTVKGNVVIADLTPANAASSGAAGWDTAQAGAIQDGIQFIATNVLNVLAAGVSLNVGAFTAATLYTVIVGQRAAGFWFWIKGGAEYPTFRLVWVSATGAPGALYPAVGATGIASIFTADNVRVPLTTYIPQPLAYDTFTRVNGALGSTETTGPDAQALTALAWAFSTGIWTISTNAAIATPVIGADVIVNGAFAADSDWTKGAGWAIGSGTANATLASSDLSQTVAPLTVGLWYQISYTLSARTAGTVAAQVGGFNLNAHSLNATYTETSLARSTAFLMRGAGLTASIDNVTAKPLVIAELFASVQTSTADVIADVNITLEGALSGKQAGLVLNLDSVSNPQNFILVYLDGRSALTLTRCVAGVYLDIINLAITYSAGAKLRVIREGTKVRIFYNNAAFSTVQTVPASSAVLHGLFSTSPLSSLDAFTLWSRGTNGEYSALEGL